MRNISYAQALNEAITEEMLSDNNIVFMGEDIGQYGGAFGVSKNMLKTFGSNRIIDTPISELAFTGCAAGAAMAGLRTIVEIMFSDFITLAMDPIVNQAAKNYFQFGGQRSVPMVVRTPSGAGTGAGAQHSQNLEAWLAHIPGLKVVIPSTPYDAKGLLKASIRDNNPVIFYEHKLLYKTMGNVPIPSNDYSIPLGQADIKKEGTDISIFCYGKMVLDCLEAAEYLSSKNINAEVVDLRSLRPLDSTAIIESAKKTGRILVVHEANKHGGFGGEIISTIVESEAFNSLKTSPKRLCGLEIPIPFNKKLEAASIPSTDRIIESAINICKK